MVASIPNGTLRDEFNRAGQISARAETETETEDFAQFRPGRGGEASLSKFAVVAVAVIRPADGLIAVPEKTMALGGPRFV